MAGGNIVTSTVVIAMVITTLLSASCQPLEQGYWAKPGLSQTEVSKEYGRDSEACARQGVEQVTVNTTPEGETIETRQVSASTRGSNLYGQCMVSRGYEWITLEPLVTPSPHSRPAEQTPCLPDRVILDPFGYPHCLTADRSQRAGAANGLQNHGLPDPVSAASPVPTDSVLPEGSVSHDNLPAAHAIPKPPSMDGDDARAQNGRTAAERRIYDNTFCIQQSQTSLSVPYDTYLQCMAEKGWPAVPR